MHRTRVSGLLLIGAIVFPALLHAAEPPTDANVPPRNFTLATLPDGTIYMLGRVGNDITYRRSNDDGLNRLRNGSFFRSHRKRPRAIS